MPLLEMSLNIPEADIGGRKRSHDEFVGGSVQIGNEVDSKGLSSSDQPAKDSLIPPEENGLSHTTPQDSPGLTEPDSATPANAPCSPVTPKADSNTPKPATTNSTASTATSATVPATQPAKRKRLTAAEKEEREKEIVQKKKEREEKAAVQAENKARQEEEKAAKAKEREEKAAIQAANKAKQEEEKAAKAKEREEKRKKKAEEERVKEEKRKQAQEAKEEKNRQAQEAKEKEARKQPKLNSFFGMPRTPVKPLSGPTSKTESPKKEYPATDLPKPEKSEYQRQFKPFFLKEHTRLATPSVLMDEETRDAKSAILDEFINEEREHKVTSSFDAAAIFQLPGKFTRRGKVCSPVKQIMETIYQQTENNTDAAGGSILRLARKKLTKIPIKVIAFSQDVRPPYYGTITSRQHALGIEQMRKSARKSTNRCLPLDYDYDSEAEWQEDEDGEDVDMDDDEDEPEDEDDMDGFLDDSEDVGPARRLLANILEPECSGVCFEDGNRNGPNPAVYEHKMEFILAHPDLSTSLDPWSNAYWEPEQKKQAVPDKTTNMLPPPAPSNAFAALTASTTNSTGAQAKLVKPEIMNDVKKAILDNKGLSKIGIIEFVFQQFRDNASRTEVKNTIELVAEKKKGTGKTKEWDLKPGHEIKL